jgi:hypothetical protein
MVKLKKDKINEKDLGLIDDALYVLRNLCAWEDHLARQIEKTDEGEEKVKFINLLNKVRIRRSLIMDLVVTESPKGSEWCQTKHACNASMGFIELGNRFSYMGHEGDNAKKAIRCFNESKECEDDILEINNISKEQKEVKSDA